ncbi:MAG: hypothetical protein VB979_00080 [Acinetobacter sp.]|uniref:hypothetical protein n=1 Tax=Acinetobacter sp. TaxID=472 RepID=UPI0039820A0C
MATDVDVQYFSHLNGLTLGNNWGDLIRLLDKALVTGIDFTQITAASIDAQGDVHITLYSAHNAMLFQVVELIGFAPASFNQKYRIKGVPNTTQLILKPHTAIAETSITTVGAGKLASLGYEIIFRDANDVKRVYRAKNPTSKHPFIRVDESLTSPDGTTGVYTSTYAKYAMVGLLEHMDHIDDYENPDVLQLPFDPSNLAKNWEISGTGSGVVRGWSRWYWARSTLPNVSDTSNDTSASNGNRKFTLVGTGDLFYLLTELIPGGTGKILNAAGYVINDSHSPKNNWVLMCTLSTYSALQSQGDQYGYWGNGTGYQPLMRNTTTGCFYTNKDDINHDSHVFAYPIQHDFNSGNNSNFSSMDVPAVEIPFYDAGKKLRGTLPTICYAGKLISNTDTTVIISNASMYISDVAMNTNSVGGFYFYLGDIE